MARWTGAEYAVALRHDEPAGAYNPQFRQLLHVGYKVAAEMGPRYLNALEKLAPVIAGQVTENLFARHILTLFLGP